MTPYDKTYSYEILWQQPRRWGYEISIGIFKGKDIQDTFLLTYNSPPSEKELNLDTIRRVEAWINRPPEPIPEKVFMEREIVNLLIEKGYLNEGDKLEDLPEKELSNG